MYIESAGTLADHIRKTNQTSITPTDWKTHTIKCHYLL